ncbi:unnamed protein product [Cylicocyclus nassatus]|uniref:Uncharacterized protein n=1 Tax=Cylicocyclus nassatus TaxID=53992 RepID=A0AA36M5H3_CYLNA|nr:unnamed protein product [Cylicocyclus nassatus]
MSMSSSFSHKFCEHRMVFRILQGQSTGTIELLLVVLIPSLNAFIDLNSTTQLFRYILLARISLRWIKSMILSRIVCGNNINWEDGGYKTVHPLHSMVITILLERADTECSGP